MKNNLNYQKREQKQKIAKRIRTIVLILFAISAVCVVITIINAAFGGLNSVLDDRGIP